MKRLFTTSRVWRHLKSTLVCNLSNPVWFACLLGCRGEDHQFSVDNCSCCRMFFPRSNVWDQKIFAIFWRRCSVIAVLVVLSSLPRNLSFKASIVGTSNSPGFLYRKKIMIHLHHTVVLRFSSFAYHSMLWLFPPTPWAHQRQSCARNQMLPALFLGRYMVRIFVYWR